MLQVPKNLAVVMEEAKVGTFVLLLAMFPIGKQANDTVEIYIIDQCYLRII